MQSVNASTKAVRDLTLSEYMEIVNRHNESHPDTAYKSNANLDHLNRTTKIGEEFKTESNIQNVIRRGIEFQIFETSFDKASNKYCKRTEDGSDYLRDDGGNLIPYSFDEKVKMLGESRFEIEHEIRLKDTGQIVASTEDDWNCLLYIVAEEYQGFGLAGLLLDKHHEVRPFRHTGGFTPSGERGFERFYKSKIREAMREGYYSRSVRDGVMTTGGVKAILESADVYNWLKDEPAFKENSRYRESVLSRLNLDDSVFSMEHNYLNDNKFRMTNPESFSKNNLNFSKPENLVMYVEGATAILYDKTIYDLISDTNGVGINNEFFFEKAIKGYVYNGGIMTPNTPDKIYGFYAENEMIEKYMHVVALNLSIGEELMIRPEQLELFKSLPFADKLEFGSCLDFTTVKLNSPSMNLDSISRYESHVRGISDNKFGEKFNLVHEGAYALAEENENSLKFHQAPELTFEEKLKQHLDRPSISTVPLNNATARKKGFNPKM